FRSTGAPPSMISAVPFHTKLGAYPSASAAAASARVAAASARAAVVGSTTTAVPPDDGTGAARDRSTVEPAGSFTLKVPMRTCPSRMMDTSYVQSVGFRLVSSVAGKTMPLSPAPPSAAAVQRYPSESITPLAGRAARIIGPCAPLYRTDLIDGVIVTVPPVADVIFGSRSGS